MTPPPRREVAEPNFRAVFSESKPARTAKAKGRKPMRRRFSEKSAEQFDYQKSQRQRVFERDGGCVVAGELFIRQDGTVEEHHECLGRLTVHHRRKRSSGGGWMDANLLTLCWASNLTVEDQPAWVREHYPWLVVREGDEAWDSLARTPRRRT